MARRSGGRRLRRQRRLRGRARRRHRQALQQRQRGRGRRLHLRLHLRRRRDRGRHHQQGPDLRPVGAGEELRHLRRVRPGDRDRARPDEPVDPHGAGRRGAPELPGQRHDLPAAQAGEPCVAGHDAAARRRDRLRHLDRGQRHARGEQPIEITIEGIGTLSNTFVQQVPFRYAEGDPKPMQSAWSGPARSAG